jgi:hypothetical protein
MSHPRRHVHLLSEDIEHVAVPVAYLLVCRQRLLNIEVQKRTRIARIEWSAPGDYMEPGPGHDKATVHTSSRMQFVHLAAHVHPSGVSGQWGFKQEPTVPEDFNAAFPDAINAVIGAADQVVRFFTRSRTIASLPLGIIRR